MPKVKPDQVKEKVKKLKERFAVVAKAATAPTADLKLRSARKKLKRAQRKLRQITGKKLAARKAAAAKE